MSGGLFVLPSISETGSSANKSIKAMCGKGRRKKKSMNSKIVIRSETDADVEAITEVTVAAEGFKCSRMLSRWTSGLLQEIRVQ
jgi:hypothetical protein